MSIAITDASEKIDQIFEVVYSQQTKEHAIKAILAFDIAVKLSEELKQAQSA